MATIDDKFRYNIAERMHRKGWTSKDLAAELGVSQAYVCQLLSGHRNPGLATLQSIADALGVSPASLIKG